MIGSSMASSSDSLKVLSVDVISRGLFLIGSFKFIHLCVMIGLTGP